MIKKLLAVLLVFNCTLSFAQTIKTDILVIGGGASGTAAAIQGARSKLKTLLVEQGPWLGGSMTAGGMCIVEGNRNLPTGIWGEFRRRVRDFYSKTPGYDTAYNATLRFEPYTGAAILKKITDTVKNLTVKLNTPFTGIKKDGTGWDVSISLDGKTTTVKAKVVIDATETGDVAAKAGETFVYGFDSKKQTTEALAPDNESAQLQDLTWIAILKDFGASADKTIPQPEGYDASAYACLKGKNIKQMLTDGRLPNDKYMIKWAECGNQFPVTADNLKPENREAFYVKARLHTLGLIYYLQTELGYKNLGVDDGFTTPDHLPYIPYLREAGRVTKGLVRMMLDDVYKPYNRESKLYRTAIAVGDAYPGQHYTDAGAPKVNYPPFPAYGVPLGAIVLKDLDNLLVTEKATSVTHLVNASTMYPSVQMAIGQGAGATAAYCAFFKTTTQNLNVRIIQGELLDFKAWLIPFTDIKPNDPYFRAIQQVGASGLLKGVQKTEGNSTRLLFQPDSLVATAEIKPTLEETYTRGFLWFNKEKPGAVFTVGNLLSFISETTLTDPHTLEIAMQKAWREQYKFNSPFDMKRPVTRREFAILANRFFNPFARSVDIAGRMMN
ncbi:FAD-dependent oxidoreductase [Mucilaginibacter rubeus]|uniref:FAD-dependent oxidoreductase n=1 Tax=Mucilaginibacter rubeus TaxID=2027860 RepID=A0A5C1I5Z9_9SPHI|nr:FAD-dependent oxidoreductase [Mucilaginibacter rubeus]QEM13343.1 FAD-dependent oxidoreductase [Mucilaginibacter rubeus]